MIEAVVWAVVSILIVGLILYLLSLVVHFAASKFPPPGVGAKIVDVLDIVLLIVFILYVIMKLLTFVK